MAGVRATRRTSKKLLTDTNGASPNGAVGLPDTGSGSGPPTQPEKDPKQYELDKHEWWVAAAVGLWLAVLGMASLLASVWAWAVADRAHTANVAVHWVGPDFTASAATSALVLAVVGGVTGSFVHAASLFAARVGRRTFEVSFFWWYLLRPLESALVAMIFVAAIRSGLVALGTDTQNGAATVLAFLSGALAGLFTDRVMQRLRGLLGATKVDKKASEQHAPGTPATVSTS